MDISALLQKQAALLREIIAQKEAKPPLSTHLIQILDQQGCISAGRVQNAGELVSVQIDNMGEALRRRTDQLIAITEFAASLCVRLSRTQTGLQEVKELFKGIESMAITGKIPGVSKPKAWD